MTGVVHLFRPEKNMARLNKSARGIELPEFDGEAMVELLKIFVKLEERFIPEYVTCLSSPTFTTYE